MAKIAGYGLTFIPGGGGGGTDPTITTLTEGQVPKANSSQKLVYGGATVDPTTLEWTFDNSIHVPPGSINVGEVLQLSEGVADLVVVDLLKDQMAFSVNSDFSDATGSSVPSYLKFGDPFDVDINIDDSQVLTTNPLDFSITGTATPPEVTLVDRSTLRTNGPMTNVTMRVTDNATGTVVRYIPSKAAWDGVQPGLSLGGPLDIMFFFSQEGTDTATEYYFGFVPFLVENGQQLDFSFKGDSVDLKGEIGGTPYLVLEVHDGPPTDLSDKETATRNQTTGLLEGGVITQDSGTTVDWTAGRGQVSDYTDPENPVITDVTWDAVAGFTITNVASEDGTLIGYNSAGAVVEILVSAYVAADERENIILGLVTHTSGAIVNVLTAPFNVAYDGIESFNAFMSQVIGPANVDGNIYGANGANLNIDVIGGNAFILGSNFRIDPGQSDTVTLPSQAPVTFFRNYRTAGAGASVVFETPPTTAIDPTMYDDGSGTLQAVPAGSWTIQRIFRSRGNTTTVSYGQAIFSSQVLALDALGSESFTEKSPLPHMLFRSSLVIAESATNLSDTAQAEFFNQSSFRITGAQSAASTIPGITSPGGADTNIQFNAGGTFGGDSNFVYNDSTKTVTLKSEVSNTTSIDFTNSLDVAKGRIEYSQSSDTFSVISENILSLRSVEGTIHGRANATASTNYFELINPNATAESGILIDNNTGDLQLRLMYDQTDDLCRLGITATNGLDLELSGANKAFNFKGLAHPFTDSVITLETLGANGAKTEIFVGLVDPEGAVTSSGGIYVRVDGNSSKLFFKETGAGNTGWVGMGDMSGPPSSIVNSMARFEDTTGKLLQSIGAARIELTATDTSIVLSPQLSNGSDRIIFENSAITEEASISYDTGSNVLTLSSDVGSINLFPSATGKVTLGNVNSANTQALMSLDNSSGVDGGALNWFVSTVTPLNAITGNPGNFCDFVSGEDSKLYYHRGASANVDDWYYLANVLETPSSEYLELNAHTVAGQVGIHGFDSLGAQRMDIFWDENTQDLNINNTGTGGFGLQAPGAAVITSLSSSVDIFSGTGVFDFTAGVGAATSFIDNVSPNATATTGFRIQNNVGGEELFIAYDQNSDVGQFRVGTDWTFNNVINNGDFIFSLSVGGQLQVTSTSASTDSHFSLENTGANAGNTEFYTRDSTPQGAVTAKPGSVCYVEGDASSRIFMHLGVAVTNSDWASLTIGVSASTDNAIPTFSGTGGVIQDNANFLYQDDGADNTLFIDVPSALGTSNILFDDFAGAPKGLIQLTDGGSFLVNSSDVLDLTASGNMGISFGGGDLDILPGTGFFSEMSLHSGAPGSSIALSFKNSVGTDKGHLLYSGGADSLTWLCFASSFIINSDSTTFLINASTAPIEIQAAAGESVVISTGGVSISNPPLKIDTSLGTNGGATSFYATGITPVGNITGVPGEIAVLEDGVDSNLYQHIGAASNDTDWAQCVGGSAILTWGNGAIQNTTATRYLSPGYDQDLANTTTHQYVVSRDGFLRNMYILCRVAAGNGLDVVYTVRINSIGTALAVTLASNVLQGSNTSTTIAVSAGDIIGIEVTKAAIIGASPQDIMCSMELV